MDIVSWYSTLYARFPLPDHGKPAVETGTELLSRIFEEFAVRDCDDPDRLAGNTFYCLVVSFIGVGGFCRNFGHGFADISLVDHYSPNCTLF